MPVRLIGPLFLGLLGATAAEATQVVGALLLFGLIAAPPAAAQRLTDRPWHALAVSALVATVSVWAGIAIAYAAPTLPVSFAILSVSTGLYAVAATSNEHLLKSLTDNVSGKTAPQLVVFFSNGAFGGIIKKFADGAR